LLWGAYHGALISGYHILTYRQRNSAAGATEPDRHPIRQLGAMLLTFAFVSLGWILFRSASIAQAFGLLKRAFVPGPYAYRVLSGTFYLHVALLTLAVWLAPLVTQRIVAWVNASQESPKSAVVYWLAQGCILGAMLVLCLIYLGQQTAFIYFQF
jgi:hypothetical protein